MKQEKLISVSDLCQYYEVEASFFETLEEEGLITLTYVKNNYYLEHEAILKTEKIIRIYKELNINIEGIDVVFNLLQKVDYLQQELVQIKNKLRLYEG